MKNKSFEIGINAASILVPVDKRCRRTTQFYELFTVILNCLPFLLTHFFEEIKCNLFCRSFYNDPLNEKFAMSEEYFKVNRTCVAPYKSNWHRVKIISLDRLHQQQVKVCEQNF